MHSLACRSGGLFSVGVGSGLVSQPAGPEVVEQRVALAQGVGAELQEGFAVVLAEELFAPFHADVDEIDRQFDVAARQRQALLAVLRIVHPILMIGEIGDRAFQGIIRDRLIARNGIESLLAGRQFGDDLLHVPPPCKIQLA